MRREPSILHIDLDAFFAAVEQRDKPSLRGKPVIVGGLGPRGVVATASYEARRYGVGSAMPMARARALCPHAAFLAGRLPAYRAVSAVVMGILAAAAPTVEVLSLDEAFLDVGPGAGTATCRRIGAGLKRDVLAETGLTCSVGAGTSKLIAKIAAGLHKPDGLVVIPAGDETALLHPMPVTRLPGVGPTTAERLRRAGVHTVGDLTHLDPGDLAGLVGQAAGRSLAMLSRAEDDRPVSTQRETRSISAEDTFDADVAGADALAGILIRTSARVCARLRGAGLCARTVTVKVRRHDFATVSRSSTLANPTDDPDTITATGRRLLAGIDISDGVRLLGVAVSGLGDWSQDMLFPSDRAQTPDLRVTDVPAAGAPVTGAPVTGAPVTGSLAAGPPAEAVPGSDRSGRTTWVPGQDVHHDRHGAGWVWGAGRGLVSVRFETRASRPGPVRTLPADDPELHTGPTPEPTQAPDRRQ